MTAPRLRPLGIGEILDAAIKIYRSRFKTLVKATFLVVAPVQVLSAIVTISLPGTNSFNQTDAFGDPTVPDTATVVGAVAAVLIVAVLGFVASQLATATSVRIVSNAYLDEEEDWRASLRFATSRLRSLVWLFIKIGFLAGLGFLACAIPGIYFYFAWSMAVPVLLLENLRGKQAMKRSRALVKGRWWPVFGGIFVAGLLGSIVSVGFTAASAGVGSAADNAVIEAIVQAISSTGASVLVTPFSAAVTLIIYFDLRVRKEGFDLELLARTLGVEPPVDGDAGAPAWTPDPVVAPSPFPTAPGAEQPPYWPPPPGWRPEGG